MSTRRRLGIEVLPRLDGPRIDRQWEGVLRAERRALARWRLLGAAGALTAALAIGFAAAPRAPTAGEILVARERPSEILLPDGSAVIVETGAVLIGMVEARVIELVLESGTAAFDVPHVDGRRFVVRVGGVEIHADQAAFRVQGTPMEIVVTRGSAAEVWRDGAVLARIAVGETWSEGGPAVASP